ncbi:MAG: EamA family transporter, partial [Defluviitaleaceae bacterium]|nr:EamA family transporter [Defluviitaleaceae bacterium]
MELWLIYAILASALAGITSIFSKIGVKNVNSHLATAIRTVVIVIFSWVIVFITGSHEEIRAVSANTWIFLVLSGLATGGSWLCFFYALKFGTVSNVSPLKKSSTILTVLLAFFILNEPVGLPQIFGIMFIAAGTFLMLDKKESQKEQGK